MVKILEIDLFDNGIELASNLIVEQCEENRLNFCISATGAHGMILAKKNTEFKSLLNSFYLNLPDGMPGVWIGRLKGAKYMQRCYGPDFFKEMILKTANKSINHFFCGGNEGVANELKKVCEEKFGNNNIVGVYCPPFREMSNDEIKELAQRINSLNTNIVWIGISTPKQEIFASRLSKYTKVNFLCTVGAAFDFHIGKVEQAPKWVQKIGMEWFFRLTKEPKRLWKRYFEIVPLFLWYNFLEMVNDVFFESKEKKNV
jgi:N-acetylglucosaminyldiphosphoundecaprenol N-acetyl-beta-D-mannosaminyltransferase